LPTTGASTSGSVGLLLLGSTSMPVQFTAPGLDYAFAITEQLAGSTVMFQ
jgi:hypothetical protein